MKIVHALKWTAMVLVVGLGAKASDRGALNGLPEQGSLHAPGLPTSATVASVSVLDAVRMAGRKLVSARQARQPRRRLKESAVPEDYRAVMGPLLQT